MSKAKCNLIQLGGNVLFFLLILVIMLDPTNSVLHLKNVVFILLVGYNIIFFKPDFTYLPHILLIFGTLFLGYVLAEMQMNAVDMEVFGGVVKGFSPLILLLWIRHYNVLRLSIFPILLACLLVDILFILATTNETIQLALYTFVWAHDDMIMMSSRTILGFNIFGMYYKSMLCATFVLLSLYQHILQGNKRRVLYILAAAVVTFAFLISGTRSPMLLPFALFGAIAFLKIGTLRKSRYFYYPVIVLGMLLFIGFVLLLATEKGEISNQVKAAHLQSYMELFETHPIYLLLGQGPGTAFYSEGFHAMTYTTEWTYMELLRCYGAFSLLIFAVMIYPITQLYKLRHDKRVAAMIFAYIFYLLIAGTNPLLISSTGMLVLLTIYSYTQRATTTRLLPVSTGLGPVETRSNPVLTK